MPKIKTTTQASARELQQLFDVIGDDADKMRALIVLMDSMIAKRKPPHLRRRKKKTTSVY